ncbi:MAG: aminopeptidase P family protein [Bacteroidetes bacterium SB0662_bin_6]|nr:aminopeptidase P family protein [Bacteroidetes bacterium SB0668_bin_1]MYE04917.1 aminopeptidase P family protein [Bacteroidetes bacterium SB0662_bin_6]
MDRISSLRALLRTLSADALYLTHYAHVRWACGFKGSYGVLIVRADAAHFVTDGRYRTQAGEEVRDVSVHVIRPTQRDALEYMEAEGLLKGVPRVAYVSDRLTVSSLEMLQKRFPGVEWIGTPGLLNELVARKSPDELKRIRAAQALTGEVFESLKQWIRPGRTEKEIAAEIVAGHLRRGADRMSFDPIVASGLHSALPHAQPTGRPVQAGDVLLLDFGCFLDGYASDMTRTVAVGPPDPLVPEIYDLVRSAQECALWHARAGMPAREVDALARDVIREGGYEEAFSHSLGHGIGLEIHEWPRLSRLVDDVLPDGCVVSIEPGVYLPGRFGIRIEDVVCLREDGVSNLTDASKEWTVL